MAKFIADAQIEARAATIWRQHSLAVNFDVEDLLDRLELGTLWEELEHEVLGLLIPSQRLVVINQGRRDDFERNQGLYRFTVGHEIGHWVMHCEDDRAGSMQLIEGERTWCRQGSRDPREIQAEKFASFLLAPTDALKAWIPKEAWSGWPTVYKLAGSFGMSATAMIVRMEQAQFAHRDQAGIPRSGRPRQHGQLELGFDARGELRSRS